VALLAGPRRHADAADRRATQVAPPYAAPDHGGPAGRGTFLDRGQRDWLGILFFLVSNFSLESRFILRCYRAENNTRHRYSTYLVAGRCSGSVDISYGSGSGNKKYGSGSRRPVNVIPDNLYRFIPDSTWTFA
jgi:hypothetical protein